MNSSTNQDKLIYHLSELRKTLLSIIVCLIIFFPIGYFLAPHIIDFIVKWSFSNNIAQLNFFSPMEVFLANLKIGFIVAFAFSFPFTMYKIWEFLLPALYEKEKKFLKVAVITSTILFLLGATLCIAFVLPLIIKFSMSFATEHIKPILGLSNFLGLSGWLLLAFGLMFQFPIIVFFLVRMNIISLETLVNKRPYVAVIILVISALLTPPDVVSQVLLAVPTYLLFELGIFFSKISR